MPPKRLTNLPSNIFLEHIAPRLKTRNIARLNIATGRKVPGLTQEARKIDAERKQAAIAIVKKQQHALAMRKKNSANATNRAWLNRYSRGKGKLYKFYVGNGENSIFTAMKSLFKFRGFGGLVIHIQFFPEQLDVNGGSMDEFWDIQVYDNLAPGTWPNYPSKSKFWVRISDFGTGTGTLEIEELIRSIRTDFAPAVFRFYETILTPVIEEVISTWNALPAANRA